MASAGTLGWSLKWELDPGGGVLVSVAQFFLYLPFQPEFRAGLGREGYFVTD